MVLKKNSRKRKGFDKRLDGYGKTASATLAVDGKKSMAGKALRYTAAGAAGLALAAGQTTDAEAAGIVSVVVTGAPIVVLPGSSFPININLPGYGPTSATDTMADFVFSNLLFPMISAWPLAYSAYNLIATAPATGPSPPLALNIPYSMPIGSSLFGGSPGPKVINYFGAGSFPTTTGPATPGGNYLGIQFFNTKTGGLHYAWMDIDVTGPGVLTIHSWAWETTPFAPIGAGHIAPAYAPPVPEPTSLALLAMGAGGLMAWRRKKKKSLDV